MKKLIILLLTIFALNSCEEDTTIIDATANKKMEKVKVCHYDAETESWKTININGNALKAHLDHGDYEGECEEKTYVPDDVLEQYLICKGYDEGPLDDYVPTANINAIEYLNLQQDPPCKVGSPYNILDLTGIEDFKALKELRCVYGTNLDLTKLTKLDFLYIEQYKESTIDLSRNTLLKSLTIACASPFKLKQIDISENKLLEDFSTLSDLTSIDFTNNPELKQITMQRGTMTSLDLSKNTKLERLHLDNIQTINNLDLTNNKLLFHIWVMRCQEIIYLDLSANSALTEIVIHSNDKLSGLNVKNGNYLNVTRFEVARDPGSGWPANSPSLGCIQVDNFAYSSANWDLTYTPNAYFSEDCGY